MSLPSITQGSRRISPRITWLRTNGKPVDLTSGSITGNKKNITTGIKDSITGALSITDGTNGVFTWAFSVADVATSGNFSVQFRCTYPDSLFEDSFPEPWEVIGSL